MKWENKEVGGLLVRHIDMNKIISILIILIGIALDYAYRNIYYSFSFLGYMIVYYISHRDKDTHTLLNYVCDFIFIPSVLKVVIVIVLNWL